MTNAIFLTSSEPYSGKSVIALGLMNLLAGKTEKIAYFKPVINSVANQTDSHLEMIAKHFNLRLPYSEMFVFNLNDKGMLK